MKLLIVLFLNIKYNIYIVVKESAMIYDFISNICDILDIAIPSVSFDTSNFSTDTMMAQVDLSGKQIYLKRHGKPNPDLLFSIAHELRHIWQMQHDRALYFSSYRPVQELASIDEYNLQLAELDANAFAGLVMIDFFQLEPLYEGLSDFAKTKVYERMRYLESTEFSR